MVSKPEIGPRSLEECSAVERDARLADAFDLSPTTLASLRAKCLEEAVADAATLLADRGYPRRITTPTLAAILSDGWETSEQYTSAISRALRRRYQDKKALAEAEYDLSPPYIHFLRREVGAYEGNLLAVRDRYPNFRPSIVDYPRNVRLPATIGFDEARLLGAYAVVGAYQTIQDTQPVLRLDGTGEDWEWYRCLQETIRTVHNLIVGIPVHETTFHEVPGERYRKRCPRITLRSQATTTWLQDDLDIALATEQRRLPEPDWPGDLQDQRRGLLAGALAGMGQIHEKKRYKATRPATQLLADVAALAEQLDVEALVREPTTALGTDAAQLVFDTAAVDTLADRNLFWNPRHRRAVTERD